MHIHQYALFLRVHIIIPVLLIKNSVIMRIRILVHGAQPISIIFMNTHYNGFFYKHSDNWLWTLKSVAENWVWEKFSSDFK